MRNSNRVVFTALLSLFAGAIGSNTAWSAVTWLGPSPYLSSADSPFAANLDGPNFFLEDFEDGELNTPGIFQPLQHAFGSLWHGEVMAPGDLTDSVDSDDGAVDRSGTAGHSFRSQEWTYNSTVPQRNTVAFEFEFDPTELGYLPDTFGFVWTDGPAGIDFFRPGLDLRLVITDSDGNEHDAPPVKPFVNIHRNGQTSEDLFLGVISDVPIAAVRIAAIYYGDAETMPYLEIDHVQYGRTTLPEPGTFSLLVFLVATFSCWKVTCACRTIGVLKRP